MFDAYIKLDKQKVWRKLSVSAPALDGLKFEAVLYVEQYAIDNQLNPSQLAFKIVDRTTGKDVYLRESNAQANKGTK